MPQRLSLRDRKKVETRDRLARAGFELVVERGYHNVTTADIADAVDVSRRTFSNYFPSKADCVAQAVHGRGREIIPAVLADTSGESVSRRLGRVLAGMPAEFWTDFTAMHAIIRDEPDVLAAHARVDREEVAAITDECVALSSGQIDRLKLHVTVSAVIACFTACLDHWAESGSTDHRELAELIGRNLEVVNLSWLEPYEDILRSAQLA